MMKKFFTGFMLVVLSMMPLSSVNVFAGEAGNDVKKADKYVEKKFNKMAEELDLTEKQKEEIKSVMASDRQQIKEINKKIKEKDKLIDEELLKENYDRTAVNTYLQEIRQLSADAAQIRTGGKIKIRNILTREQFVKIEQKKKEEMTLKKQKAKQEHQKKFEKNQNKAKAKK